MAGNTKMKILTITKENYLDFLESKLAIYIRAGEPDYFLQQLKRLCKIVPEFTSQPILHRKHKLLCFDSKFYWKDNIGRCSLRFENSWFGFDDKKVSGFRRIHIDYKSFGIKQVSDKKVHRLCGVPNNYLTPAEKKLIKEQEQKQRVKELREERAELLDKIKDLERD